MELDNIKRGLICPYCHKPTELVDSSEVYRGASFGKIYLCRACNAHVRCYAATERAMGSVANDELRRLRKETHKWFDLIWKKRIKKSRYNAYSWLSLRLHLNKDITHIGMFDEETCRRAIAICKAKITSL